MYTEACTHNTTTARIPCCICGQCYQQNNAAIALVDGDHSDAPPDSMSISRPGYVGDVCRECAVSPQVAAERARENARGLRAWADSLDSLAEKVLATAPWATPADLDAAEAEFERRYFADASVDKIRF